MAEYKAIHGTLFQHKTSDPLATGLPGATWSSGGNMNSARRVLGAAGIYTAGLAFGGTPAPLKAYTESYNGSSWTEVGDLNTGRRDIAGNGTQTAAIAFGGDSPPYTGETETWNGSSWTEVADLNQARAYNASSISGIRL